MGEKDLRIFYFGLIGTLLGGVIGLLFRPSAPFIGQISLEHVFTRGTNLRGPDQLLRPIAEASFTYMIVGMVIGGACGVIGGFIFSNKKSPASSPSTEMQARPTPPKNIELGNTLEQVEAVLGQPEKIINLGTKVIHVYKDMKIIYVNGKVTDVQ